jgi:hypothetical protein
VKTDIVIHFGWFAASNDAKHLYRNADLDGGLAAPG